MQRPIKTIPILLSLLLTFSSGCSHLPVESCVIVDDIWMSCYDPRLEDKKYHRTFMNAGGYWCTNPDDLGIVLESCLKGQKVAPEIITESCIINPRKKILACYDETLEDPEYELGYLEAQKYWCTNPTDLRFIIERCFENREAIRAGR